MQTLFFILKMLMVMVFITFCTFVASYFISIFLPNEVVRAIEIFKTIFG
jgi:hypothetical protein